MLRLSNRLIPLTYLLHTRFIFTRLVGCFSLLIRVISSLVFPSFTNKPRNVTVKTGQSAKLLCEATGYPQPFLSWSKDGGKNFPAARDRRFLVNPGNLNEFIIKDVQWADRGDYFCNATNSAGSIISNATVNVLGE